MLAMSEGRTAIVEYLVSRGIRCIHFICYFCHILVSLTARLCVVVVPGGLLKML